MRRVEISAIRALDSINVFCAVLKHRDLLLSDLWLMSDLGESEEPQGAAADRSECQNSMRGSRTLMRSSAPPSDEATDGEPARGVSRWGQPCGGRHPLPPRSETPGGVTRSDALNRVRLHVCCL